MPVSVSDMNYSSVILVGVVVLTAIWWLLHAVKHYPGPKVMNMYIHDDSHPQPVPEGGALSSSDEKTAS